MIKDQDTKDYRALMKKALLELRNMKSKVASLESAKSEPIAIIGMGCRFPGGVNSPEALWKLLRDGVDTVTKIPSDRWDWETYYDQDPETPGKMDSPYGAFIGNLQDFDAQFFGISPREALSLDPQQRLLLEVSWEALENAGLNPQQLRKTKTGVFIGIYNSDYSALLLKRELSEIDAYLGIGSTHSTASGRISYTLGLTGPSISIDTACSSSLVGVHLACQSLRNQESNLALVGGVNRFFLPEYEIYFSKARMLSPDGHCKAFDASANGFVRGEGCGIIVLKRLSDAVADRENVLAVIRGSAVNQDGRSVGLTAPNGSSQQTVIREALENAGVEPDQVSYIEAHGTGTSLGDPIEVGALGEVFGASHSADNLLQIGSIKTNIGHTEAAAGIAGLMKVVLQLQHQEIAPHLHLKTPNPHIDWENLPIKVTTQGTAWKSDPDQPRIAGVSSFGVSGTNSHVVLEESKVLKVKSQKSKVKSKDNLETSAHLLTLSAKTETALQDLSRRYHHHLTGHPELDIADVCFTANNGRADFEHRLAIVAGSSQELTGKLDSFNSGEEVIGLSQGLSDTSSRKPKIAFLFTGQGSQYLNMGQELYQTQPLFRQTLEKCQEILLPYLEIPLLQIIYPNLDSESAYAERYPLGLGLITDNRSLITDYAQPAIFAIEYALATLWQSWGIEPDIVMGHSVGEYVAACIAGVFSLEDALTLVAHRGRLMQQLPAGGGMVALMASVEQAENAIAPYAQQVAIAAFNGPTNIVISGEQQALEVICQQLEKQRIKTKALQVSHAFHSHLIEPMLEEFAAITGSIKYSQPQINLISNVTGKRITEEIATTEYWVNHVRQPVRFAESVKTLDQEGYEIFLEIGSRPILLGMAQQCLAENTGVWLPSLRSEQNDWQQMLDSLGNLYVKGVDINWQRFDQDYQRHKVILPTYAFQPQKYWVEPYQISKTEPGSSHQISSPILELLQQGKTQKLAEQLENIGKLSPEQLKLLPEILELLTTEHQKQLTEIKFQDWLYQVQWEPVAQKLKLKQSQPIHWLIFADSTGTAEDLGSQLKQQNYDYTLVFSGEAYQNDEPGIYYVNPAHSQDFQRLWQAIITTQGLPVTQIVHFWSLETSSEKLTNTTLAKAQKLGCNSVLYLLQSLLKLNQDNLPKLWLVTRGIQPVEVGAINTEIASASLWGLGKVIALEHPQIWGGMIDLDLQTSDKEGEIILKHLENPQGENQLAVRQGKYYGARLVPLLKNNVTSEFRLATSESTYLITGGLGALGLQVAQWLSKKGAKNLVLMGRRGAGEEAKRVISQLEQTGTKVLVAQGDVAKVEDVTNILEQINSTLPPLRGLIHTAGVIDDGVLAKLSWDSWEKVMAPKVQGSWNLHQLTQNLSLDFFVCFSSAASLLGSVAQGNYAAANSFMDALAHYRQAQGLPALTINWGVWGETGMAAQLDQSYQERLKTRGITPLSAAQGLQILEQLLNKSLPQIGVFAIAWSTFVQTSSLGSPSPFLARLLQEEQLQQPTTTTENQKGQLLAKLEAAPERERQNILRIHLQQQIQKILGLNNSQVLGTTQGFVDMGMDSLMAVELNNRLQAQLDTNLPATLAIEYPTIEKLSKHLAEEVMGWKPEVEMEDKLLSVEEDKLSDLTNLSDEEAQARLANTLSNMGY
ncbi:MAG: type I polyketide synthase [Cyanobacteria bacterium P01_F01_bin.143]